MLCSVLLCWLFGVALICVAFGNTIFVRLLMVCFKLDLFVVVSAPLHWFLGVAVLIVWVEVLAVFLIWIVVVALRILIECNVGCLICVACFDLYCYAV